MRIIFRTPIKRDIGTIKNGFVEKLFLKLSPPFMALDLVRFDGCKTGDKVQIAMNFLGLKQRWESLITHEETSPSLWMFVDEGIVLPWPLSKWRHEHKVRFITTSSSEIIDDIKFECKPKILTPVIYPFLWTVFSIRPMRYKEYFKA